jgi:hypothetical protein
MVPVAERVGHSDEAFRHNEEVTSVRESEMDIASRGRAHRRQKSGPAP